MQNVSSPDSDRAVARSWPPLIFFASVGMGLLLHWASFRWRIDSAAARPAGVVLALACGGFAFWARQVMRAAGTNIRPDQPTTAIVTTGPYRITRNPMYLSLCMLQIALGLVLRDVLFVLWVLPLGVVLHFGVVLREEAYLAGKFGAVYLRWKQTTRRWI